MQGMQGNQPSYVQTPQGEPQPYNQSFGNYEYDDGSYGESWPVATFHRNADACGQTMAKAIL